MAFVKLLRIGDTGAMKLFQPTKDADPPLDPQFESFRERLAEASIDSVNVGYLSIRVQAWFTVVGPWWRRRWVNPRWGVEWLLGFAEPYDGLHHRAGPPFEDGVELADSDVLNELAADTFRLNGDAYSLRWIDRDAWPQVWDEHYAFPARP